MDNVPAWGQCGSCGRWFYGSDTLADGGGVCSVCSSDSTLEDLVPMSPASVASNGDAPPGDVWALCDGCDRWFYCEGWGPEVGVAPACPVCTAEASVVTVVQ